MTQSDKIGDLATALAKAQGAMKAVAFDSVNKNPFFTSKYASLVAIWDAIRKPLTDNGLAIIQMILSLPDGKIGVRTVITHSSGEWISSDMEAGALPLKRTKSGEAEARDNGPQALGVVTTYLRRYSLSAALGLVSEEDDDAEAVSDHSTHTPAKAAPAKAKDAVPQDTKPGGMNEKQRKMLWAIGCTLWQREDDTGAMVPDKDRIVRELEQRSKDLGFEFKSCTTGQASELIEIFNELQKNKPATGPDGSPF